MEIPTVVILHTSDGYRVGVIIGEVGEIKPDTMKEVFNNSHILKTEFEAWELADKITDAIEDNNGCSNGIVLISLKGHFNHVCLGS